MPLSNLEKIFSEYIQGTPKQAIVKDFTIKLCIVTNEVRRVCGFPTINVHITTKVIKKNYDKRTAEENDFIVKNGWKIVHFPDSIYKNKNAKRGDYIFTKRMKNDLYLASIEVSRYANSPILYMVSSFRIRKESYLDSYSLIWSWKGGEPSS